MTKRLPTAFRSDRRPGRTSLRDRAIGPRWFARAGFRGGVASLRIAALLAPAAGLAAAYALVVRGNLMIDLGIGRRLRPLGPITETIAAPPETVFDVIAGPYLGRTPRAMQET